MVVYLEIVKMEIGNIEKIPPASKVSCILGILAIRYGTNAKVKMYNIPKGTICQFVM